MKLSKLIVVAMVITALIVINSSVNNNSSEKIDLERGLVAYWSFDEGEGDIAFDQSGNHNDGGLLCNGESCSPPKWVKGKIGYALEFDGEDNYVWVHTNSSLVITEKITISALVKPNIDGTYNQIVAKDQYNYYLLIRRSFNDFFFWIKTNEGPADARFGATAFDGLWTHVIGLYDGSYLRLYINGDLQDETSFSGSIQNQPGNFYIGSKTRARYFNGVIDEVRIYNRALQPEEIEALYEQGKLQS